MGCESLNLGFTGRLLAHECYVGIGLVFGAGQGRSQPARIGLRQGVYARILIVRNQAHNREV